MYRTLTFIPLICLFCSCSFKNEKQEWERKLQDHSSIVLESVDSHLAIHNAPLTENAEKLKPVKMPDGVYETTLPKGIQQIIHFKSDYSFLLKETYPNDSVDITEGTWTPSDGFIWIYKDQIVRGRYRWQGNVLEYFNPVLKKGFAMHSLKENQ